MKAKIAVLVVVMLVFSTIGGIFCPYIVNAATGACILRVKVSAIGSVKTLNFVPNGEYVTPDGQVLVKGETYTVYIDGSSVSLKKGSVQVYTSSAGYFRLYKTDMGYKGLEINTSKYGACNYLGDMMFAKSGSYLLAINYVDMETYLVGVVVGEIGESSHLEAIKAQAIAARTYAYKAIKSATSPTTYDIVDTSANQVYKGYRTTWKKCIQAVQETAGQIITYDNGKIAGGWYADSNGGQTRTNVNAWGGTKYPYLEVSDDIYDYNSNGVRSSLYLPKNISNIDLYSTLDYRVKEVLMTELKIALYNSGYSTLDDNIFINGIENAVMHTQRFPYESNSKCYNFIRLTVNLNAFKGDQNSDNPTGVKKTEYMRVTNVTRTAGLYDGPSSSYELLESIWAGARVEVLDKSGSYYKIKTAGGTVGYMSKSYLKDSQIVYTDAGIFVPEPDPTPEITPSPDITTDPTAGTTGTDQIEQPTDGQTTSAPDSTETTAPGSTQGAGKQQYAKIVNVNTAVNMRAEASTSSKLIGTVAKGVEVKVLSVNNTTGWAKVELADGTVGYISNAYLNFYYRDDNDITTPPEGSQTVSVMVDLFIDDIRMVSLANGVSLGSRIIYYAEEYGNYFILSMRGNGHGVGLSQRGARDRAKAGQTAQQIVYFYYPGSVISDSVYSVINPNEPEKENPNKWYGTVVNEDIMSSVNVRAEATTDSAVLGRLTYGARVEILEVLADWYKVETRYGTGYIYAPYIKPDELPDPDATPTNKPDYIITIIGTVINTSSLNVRSGPSTAYDRVAILDEGQEVTVLETDAATGWHKVRLASGAEGWASNKYMKLTEIKTEVTPSPTITDKPTSVPTDSPTSAPTNTSTTVPTATPTNTPTVTPTEKPTAAPTQGTDKQIGTVVNCNVAVNMRSGPSTSYTLIGTVAKGTKVDVLDKTGNWYYVKLANGTKGYISGSYLSVTTVTVTNTPTVKPTVTPTATPTATPTLKPTATPTVKPTATPTQGAEEKRVGTVVNCNVAVNMRSGPSTDYTLIGTVAKGTKVDVLDEIAGWYYVQLANGTKGYISGNYLSVTTVTVTNTPTVKPTATPTIKPTATPTVKPTATPTQTQGTEEKRVGTVVNCNVAVNMRSGPSTSYKLIGTVAKGTKVDVLDEIAGWYYVRLANGTKGYISGSYLSVSSVTVTNMPTVKPTATPTVKPTAKPTETPDASSGKLTATIANCNAVVNVRSGPSTSYSTVGSANKGATVTVLGKKDGWYYIELSNGTKGYASGTYISIKAISGQMAGTQSLNVRSGPSTSYDRVTILDENEKVTILDVDETGWYQVRTSSGKTGWASNKYIKLL